MIASGIFAGISAASNNNFFSRIAAADRALSERIASLAYPSGATSAPAWVAALRRISQTGSYGVGWIVVFAVVVTVVEDVLTALTAGACVLGMLACNTLVKVVVRRDRPRVSGSGAHQPASYSFPSAHTSMAVVGASVMTALVPAFAVVWWGWTAALGISRVLLGMHYAGDVAAGAALGALAAWLVALPLIGAVTNG